MDLELLVSIALGIALAATSGLRAFLPLFVAGLGARAFDALPLSENFQWLASTPALIALGVAVVVEVVADKVPALDHLLDVIQAPIRTGAGMVVCAAVLAKLPGWAAGLTAIVAGGGAALSVHATKSAVRVGSSATTGGTANPIISIVEDIACLAASVLSIVLAVVAVIVALGTVVFVFLGIRWFLRRRAAARVAVAPDP